MEVSPGALYFLLVEAALFVVLVYSILLAKKRLSPLLSGLSKSLSLSEDLFNDERNFVTSARTRYKLAAERIEEVDAHAIAAGELSSYELLHIGKWRANLGGLSELMHSAPGVFITIGLLGTFIGLVFNLDQLAAILDSGSSAPSDLIDQLSLILKPMSTAFVSSLGGVFFSLLFWLVGLLSGANRLLEESEHLLTAYLEQIVQADCNRFSLMRASVERLETSLSEFLSTFSNRVGNAIDKALSAKVDEVFDSIKAGASALESYAATMSDGVNQLQVSGNAFYKASGIFSKTSFASDFSASVELFLKAADELRKSSSSLSFDLDQAATKLPLLEAGWETISATLEKTSNQSSDLVQILGGYHTVFNDAVFELEESSKQLKATRLAINKENRQSDDLSRALIQELQNIQPSRDTLNNLLDALLSEVESAQRTSNKLAELVESNLSLKQLQPEERKKLAALLSVIADSL